ncbi:hypothetical protein, partial [Helicobacter bilis]|uniref:putative barnase/colicin E5 family endoribonuclease n=1 Tax=Helicobacter bilis TaxID=37372 RepID=UPI00248E75AB
PTTKQEISKDIESKSTQEIEKKERMHRGVYSVYYDDIMIDFVKKYDPDDDLWFMKHAKLEYSDNGEEVYAALKHFNEVRDNVSIKYDDYVAATEQVKNSLNRAALDIIDDFKATDEAFEAIEKIQTKLLDDYPQTNKNISINTKLEKDSMQIESKSTQESIKDNYIQEVETIAKDFNLTDKEAIQGLINLKDEIGKNVNLLDSVHDRQNSKRLFDNLFKDYWLDFFLANQKAYKSIKDPIALKEKISDIIFPAIQKDNGITPHTKDTHANTKQDTNTTNHTEKETSTKESYTDNRHEATQRESGADTEWITTRTSNNPQENKDTETTLKRDNGISDEYSPSSKEMAQSGNEKTHEKRDIRDDSSHSSSDIEANVNISRDTQGHNAGIRLDETDNKRYKHDGNDDRTNSRTRIHRNVSLKKKGKKDSNTNTESKVATQDIDTQSTPQVKPKKLTDKEIIDNFLKEYDNHEYGSKEISLIKNIDKPENLMYIVKAIKDFNEAKTLQDDILKIDSKAIADAGVLSLEERQQLGRGMGDLLPTLKEAFHYLHKAPYPAEIYKISNIKKRLKEVKKAYNLVQEKGLHRFDYPQTNKDVSATPQHDKEIPANTHEKETPKTTREIIKEAKASGKSVRETQELIDKNKELETNVKENTYIIPQTTQEIIKEHSKIDFATLANMPHHADDIKQVENLKAERQKLYDELAEIFDKNERHGFLDLVGKLYKTETQALKRFNEIKQDLKEGKGIRNVSNSTFNKDEYITKVGQADALNTEIDYLEVPRSLREKYPKIDKQILANVYKKIERFQRSYKDLEDYFKDVAETKIEHVLNRYPLESWETMRENYKIKDKALAKGRELEYARQQIEALLNVTPIVEFGKNYAEFYRNGSKAIQKLMAEKEGQVAGAFYRKELGDIDLVWGQVEGKGKEAKGWGLAKIIEKHLNAGDFKAFGEGEAGLINAMSEIIDKGKVITQNGVSTIWYKKDENIYKLGISKGFHKKGDNNWIITSYKAEREKDKTFGDALFTDKHPLPNSSDIIPQKPKPKQSPKELDNIESDSNPAGILNPEELATLNKEFKLGEIQDLKGQKALYDANIESLSLLDDILKSGRVATDDEKRILSNFRGFGKASNELYQVIKEKGERLDSLNKLLESLSESVGAKIDADYLFRRAGDAYYTPTPIVESMVKLAKDLGLNNNHVILEPSSGSGRFLGQFHSNANVVGIELDPFTAKLSQTIYPYFKIDNAGFQNSKFAKDDFYDLVIGNPPYSNFTIRDEAFSASAHNYFMKRGIDKLRVGGISIQIVTKSFMDSSNDLVRKEIAKNAKFLGGVRLPNNAFKEASVTTDILVFKKVSATEAKKLDNSWVETTELNGIPVSKYFVDNPQNVLGEMKVGKGQFGDIVHVINKEGIDFSNFDLMPYLNKKYDFDTLRLKDNNTHSLKDLESEVKTTQDITDSQMGAVRYDKEQDKFIKNDGGSDDELDLKEYLQSLEVTWKPETIEKRIAEYKELAPKISELQSTLKSLQKAELDSEASNETISALRQKLNSDYEAVVGKNGSFYTKDKKVSPRFKLFEMVDDTSFEIFALEKAPLVKNNKVVGAERADIFTKRVSYPYVRPQSADNLHDAMHISLNETGYNDYQRIADLLGSDVDSVKKEFLDKKLEYLDHNGERLNKDIFLSGDVKTRLESFHDEYGLPKFSDDETIAHYQKIAYEDLKNVIPDDIEVPHIEIPLGANWLDKNITDSFLSEIVGLDYLNTNYIHGAGWKVNFDGLKDRDFMIATGKDFKANTGVEYINGIDYIEDMLNNKTLVVQKTIKGDKDKTIIYRDPIATQSLESLKKQLKREFKQYILDNDSFSEIAQKQYNDTFNREVARKYDGSHLKLHGANSDIELRKHQKNAVFRFFQELSS